MTITIGNAATDRSANVPIDYTRIDYINAADGSGTLDTIEIYLQAAATDDIYIAIFEEVSANTFTSRDVVNVGPLAIGYHEITTDKASNPISLAVETGDYIGIYCASGQIELDVSGTGFYSLSGNWTSCEDEGFSFIASRQMSLSATGGAGGVVVGNVLFIFSDF